MFGKGSKIYAILTGCCPKCHQESMYKGKNLYNPSYTIKLHDTCGHCGLRYKIEPSFFYGAMYVSYALGVGLGVLVFLFCYFTFKTNLRTAFLAITLALIVLMPVIMRLARNIWIAIFISYDRSKVVETETFITK